MGREYETFLAPRRTKMRKVMEKFRSTLESNGFLTDAVGSQEIVTRTSFTPFFFVC